VLVSDDFNGVIYRVSYGEEAAPTSTPASTHSPKTIEGLVMPESAIAHPDGRVFVTEIGEFGKQGDGKVTVVNTDGSTETLVDGLNDPKGIDMFNNTLYVADVDQLVKISLDGQHEVIVEAAGFPGKPVFLNDVEIDGHGNIYVSDSGDDDGKHAGIYLITAEGKVSEIINAKSGIKRPNGLLIDGYNKMLVADFGTGDLFQLDIAAAKATKVNSGFGGADGLVRDTDGFLYISDWANGKVWQLNEPKATPQLITDEYESAADIALSADGKHILMPDMKAGKLYFLPIK
jgi:sugar lactone lactonase YvrE